MPATTTTFATRDYDLAATLTCGQAFRWEQRDGAWEGVVGRRWVRLRAGASSIAAETCEPVEGWNWLRDYLQIDLDLEAVLSSFPDDAPMRAAVDACRGLRLLHQDPWECLASFILSSTKQIVQIRQIIWRLCEQYGEAVPCPPGAGPACAFPSASRLAQAGESELRACKMGFRAPYLLGAARAVAARELDLAGLQARPLDEARAELMRLAGVGRKIADCVLLFACGNQGAFPVDVWIMRALRQLYFPRQQRSVGQLQRFASTHFGPWAGYAQQYLFHHARMRAGDRKQRTRNDDCD
jgi:N-glycosylase/DNA lyase